MNDQPPPWRTFSIFISSTFADMQAERDYLKTFVFPKVEEELQQRRIKLQIVDLRWGVDTTSINQEDEREATVLKVCLDEIRRCRPFFIGLLGDRYGWVPSEVRMKAALKGKDHNIPVRGKSVTALEIEFGVLASNEQLVRSVFYLREPLPYENFSEKKAAMFSDAFNPELSESERQERESALEKLKTTIREHFKKKKLPKKVKTYRGSWDETREKVSGLETWGDIVYEDILSECKSHAEATWDKVPQNWKERELALLDAFIEGHTAIFCGRNKLLIEIKEHLLSFEKENWGMMLTGESGSGKSSVFAMVKNMMDKEECFVLAHSAGLSHRAKNVLDLLLIWNTQLSERLGIKEETEDKVEGKTEKAAKPEIEKIQERFRELLFTVGEKQQVVLLVDGLDRFEPTERARFMTWLPTVMPGNIRLLCTAITQTEEKAVQYHNGLFVKTLELFSELEAKEMLDTLCKKQHKMLHPKVSASILGKVRADGQPATSSPLWLSLAVNMMMALDHDDFEKISRLEGRGDQQIENYMANMALDFDPLPGRLFLSLENKAGQVFGKDFTTAVFNYLACSRNGLREKDLEKLLETENIEWDPLQFAGLRRWFKAHLVIQGEELQWNLAHNILRSALIQEAGESENKRLHNKLSTYLLALIADPLKTTETLYHLFQAGELKEAAIYYGGERTREEIAGATTVLAETITTYEKGVDIAGLLPSLIANQQETFPGLLKRYIYDLCNFLAIEGNLNYRLKLLENLKSELDKTYGQNLSNVDFEFDVALIYGKSGEIHQAMGHMEEALKYFNEAVRFIKELYEANPKNERLKHGLATTYQGLGSIHQSMGHMEEALKYFEQGSGLGKELYETNPQNESLKQGLAGSYEKLGSIHQAMGHLEEALKYFKNYNQLEKERHEANPQNVSLNDGLTKSYLRLGEIHQAMGHMEEALKYFENCIQLAKKLYETNPQNESLKHGLAISHEKLGAIHQAMGHLEEALKYFINYNQLEKELYETNPQNELLKNGLASSYEKLGEIHQAMQHIEEALKYYENYNQLEEELYEANPQNERLKIGLAISYGRLGDIHQAMGHMEEALKYFDEVVRIFKELYEANPQNERSKIGLATSYDRLGAIHQAMGHMEEALKYYEKFNEISKELYEANPQNIKYLEGLGISYYKLAMIYKEIGNHPIGRGRFARWKNIISILIENMPQVTKYQDWNKEEYTETLYSNQSGSQNTHEASNSLEIIKENINQNKLHEALELLNEFEEENSLHKNAKGVCCIKLGLYAQALKYFMDITREGTFGWKETAKIEYKRNLLVSSLLLKKIDVYQGAIRDMDISEIMDEGVQRIIKTYTNWEENIKLELAKVPFYKRARLKEELKEKPITFDFPIGELDF